MLQNLLLRNMQAHHPVGADLERFGNTSAQHHENLLDILQSSDHLIGFDNQMVSEPSLGCAFVSNNPRS